jgi:hypothetical protein
VPHRDARDIVKGSTRTWSRGARGDVRRCASLRSALFERAPAADVACSTLLPRAVTLLWTPR